MLLFVFSDSKRAAFRFPSIAEKLEMIERMERGEKSTEIAQDFGINEASVRRIYRQKAHIHAHAHTLRTQQGSVDKKRRYSGIEDSHFEKVLFNWVVQQRDLGAPVSGLLIKKKAIELHAALGRSKSFKASNGWLHGFNKRHGISEFRIQGEKLPSNVVASEDFVSMFRELIEIGGYCIDNVYNADEAALFWRCLPRKTFASCNAKTSTPGYKNTQNSRISLMVCANSSATHRIPLLAIGKAAAKQPRCFKDVKTLPLPYVHQSSNACMDKDVFKHWFKNLFVPAVDEKNGGRKENIILILDNARSHPRAEELKEIAPNVEVIYLPADSTASMIRPMDQGIIESLKRDYRKLFCQEIILHTRNSHEPPCIQQFTKQWNLLKCFALLADAWENVANETMISAWNSILKGDNEPLALGESDSDELMSLVTDAMRDDLTREEIEEWLNVEEIACAALKDQDPPMEIINISDDEGEDEDEDEDEGENENDLVGNNSVSAIDAYNGIIAAYTWLLTRWDVPQECFLSLSKAKNLAASVLLNENRSENVDNLLKSTQN